MIELKPLSKIAVGVMKKRARSAAVRTLQKAYETAHKKYGLRRKDFAERIGMSPSEFSRILNGRQNISMETAEAVLRSMDFRLQVMAESLDELKDAPSNRRPETGANTGQMSFQIDTPKGGTSTASSGSFLWKID
jgi:plasmid maintenance system antidote protein VapI